MEENYEEKISKLKEAAAPLLKLLNDDYHPHVTVLITSTSIEIMEGIMCVNKIHEHLTD